MKEPHSLSEMKRLAVQREAQASPIEQFYITARGRSNPKDTAKFIVAVDCALTALKRECCCIDLDLTKVLCDACDARKRIEEILK